jgi:hypothetical protein
MRRELTATSVSMLWLVAGATMVLLSEAAYAADNPATIVPALSCEALKGKMWTDGKKIVKFINDVDWVRRCDE